MCIVALLLNVFPQNINMWLVWLMVIMSAYSGADYMLKNIDVLKEGVGQGGKK